MQRDDISVINRRGESVLATNKVLRNTYLLLGIAFAFSGLMAYLGVIHQAKHVHILLWLGITYGLIFAINAFRNNAIGILLVLAFTGFLGWSIAPMLQFYLAKFSNGGQLIATALAGTGIIFFVLSSYALVTRKDFSYLAGFLLVGFTVAIIAMVMSFFFHFPALYIAISCIFLVVSSVSILYQTSAIIHGGETNYIMATTSIFISLYNIFVSLLQILGALGGDD